MKSRPVAGEVGSSNGAGRRGRKPPDAITAHRRRAALEDSTSARSRPCCRLARAQELSAWRTAARIILDRRFAFIAKLLGLLYGADGRPTPHHRGALLPVATHACTPHLHRLLPVHAIWADEAFRAFANKQMPPLPVTTAHAAHRSKPTGFLHMLRPDKGVRAALSAGMAFGQVPGYNALLCIKYLRIAHNQGADEAVAPPRAIRAVLQGGRWIRPRCCVLSGLHTELHIEWDKNLFYQQ